MSNDYLSDLPLLEMLGLIMLGLTLLWTTISGISSLIQHWRRPKRPDAPAPLPANEREDFIRDRRREEPDRRNAASGTLPVGANRRLYNACRANGK